jgi:hypothetical protein
MISSSTQCTVGGKVPVTGIGTAVAGDGIGIGINQVARRNRKQNNSAMLSIASRAPYASNSGLKFASRLSSPWIRLGGAFQLFVGVLVMRVEHLPRNKQRRPAEPSLWVDENTDGAVSLLEKNDEPLFEGDERSGGIHSLLEENARLRGLLVKLSDLVLKNVVDAK